MTSSGYKFPFFFLLFTFSVLLSSCGRGNGQPVMAELSGLTMGTTYNIKINSRITENLRDKIRVDITAILDNIDKKMSTYIPESELSLINSNKTTAWQPVSEDLYRVLEHARYVSELTHGAFDITIGPLVNLWGFGPEEQQDTIPSTAAIAAELVNTGYQNLELRPEPRSLSKKIPGLYIDLSGIAKGYAVDNIADYLENSGYTDFMVEIGGEIRARGLNSRNKPWNIGIEKPVPGNRSVQRAVPLRNMAMATSGDYRNFFEVDGKRYSHTIDPRTGRPVDHDLVSVTVLDPSASIADALATGLLVQGTVSAKLTAEDNGIAAYLISKSGAGFDEVMTPAFSAYLQENLAGDH